jgi:hypothetical protein
MRPKLFIGSSSESKEYAHAAHAKLKDVADVTVWDEGAFRLMDNFLGRLIEIINNHDFGLFIFSQDDAAVIRDASVRVVRDNVLFELGLFIGGLGRQRSFFVTPKGQGDLHLPSDLLGIMAATFDEAEKDLETALTPACFLVQQAIARLGVRQERLGLPTVDIVNKPRVLCVTSRQFSQITIDEDIEIIRNEVRALGGEVRQELGISSSRLREVLIEAKFDLIHVRAYTSPKNGDIYFSDVDFKTGASLSEKSDCMSAESFAKLIEFAQARLVILAICDSLVLAAKLARVTNMIGATGWVHIPDFIEWEKSFFKCIIRGMSLYNSYDLAKSVADRAPMLLLARKDVAFSQ